MSSIARQPSTTKDVKKRSSKVHRRKSTKEAPPPIEELVALEVAGAEKSAYEHGLNRYLKEAPSYMNKTQMLTSGTLPPEKSFFRRNLPGILIVSLVLLFVLAVFVEQTDKDAAETGLVYPTPETTTTTGADNSTSENDVEAIFIEQGSELAGHDQVDEEE